MASLFLNYEDKYNPISRLFNNCLELLITRGECRYVHSLQKAYCIINASVFCCYETKPSYSKYLPFIIAPESTGHLSSSAVLGKTEHLGHACVCSQMATLAAGWLLQDGLFPMAHVW